MQVDILQEGDSRKRFQEQLLKSGIPETLATALGEHHTPVNYPRGSLIYTHRSSADLLFWVLSGVVKIRHRGPNGDALTMELVTPGEMLGHMITLDGQGRRSAACEARAFTNCNLALVPREVVVRALLSVENSALVSLVERANDAWSAAVNRAIALLGLSMKDRLKYVLREMGSRFGVPDERGTFIALRLEHQDLAEMIGCSRSMVTRLISELTRSGAVIAAQQQRYVLVRGRELFIERAAVAQVNRRGLKQSPLPPQASPARHSSNGRWSSSA